MARTFGRLDGAPAIEDYANNTFFHQKSGQFYRVVQRNGRVFQERYEQDEAGRKIHAIELEATHVIGSGQHSRSYLHLSPSGQLIQLPLSWYSQERRWAMSPGYDRPDHLGFTRVIDAGCLFCHNAYPPGLRGRYASRPVWPSDLPSGIDCQRCHGAGAVHARLAASGANADKVRSAIVNPRRLTPKLQMDICLQCHLQTTSAPLPHALRRFGRDVFSYRPGEPLSDYVIQFDHSPGSGHEDKFEVNNAGYRLLQSACFQKSAGRLTCITCHNPHSPQPAAAGACLQCHGPHREAGRTNCIECHMPQRRAEDAVHVVLTDHRIQRTRPARDLTAALEEKSVPYRGRLVIYEAPGLSPEERSLYLGLALVTDGAVLAPGVSLLQETIPKFTAAPVEARIGLARALAQQDRPREALEQCRTVLSSNSQLSSVRSECAKLLERIGSAHAALAEYRQALQSDPGSPAAAFGIARLSADPAESVKYYRRAAQDFSLRSSALANLGNLLTIRRDFPAAESALNEAISFDPSLAPAENNLGRLKGLQGNLRDAISHVERALQLDESYVEARFNHAQLLQAAGQGRGAIVEYRRVLAERPDFAEAHLALGSVLGDEDRIEEAIHEFREALRLRPNDMEAQRNLELAVKILRDRAK
jgi:tetratricopeptide (TPR) repeat protein